MTGFQTVDNLKKSDPGLYGLQYYNFSVRIFVCFLYLFTHRTRSFSQSKKALPFPGGALRFVVRNLLHRKLDRAEGGINRQQDNALRAVHTAFDEGGQRHDNHDKQHDRQIEYKA